MKKYRKENKERELRESQKRFYDLASGLMFGIIGFGVLIIVLAVVGLVQQTLHADFCIKQENIEKPECRQAVAVQRLPEGCLEIIDCECEHKDGGKNRRTFCHWTDVKAWLDVNSLWKSCRCT